jgi:glycolate oxidase iron-sulfur subunit
MPIDLLGPQGAAMASAVEACVHCGFCLAVCPTYRVLGDENDSPRGRIILMKEQLEGKLELEAVLPHVDRCLGCMACVPACPSGVEYGHLLAPFRARALKLRKQPLLDRAAHILAHKTIPYPKRFRLAAATGRLGKPVRRLLPKQFNAMLGLLPDSLPRAESLPMVTPAIGQRRARVALLVGCVQSVIAPRINAATVQVLARNGVEVIIPPAQGCCGSLSLHTGEQDQARRLARETLAAFRAALAEGVDAIVTNAAGCGSGMREYPLLFAGEADEATARAFAERCMDVSLFLSRLGLIEPGPLPVALQAVYHDACHLAHAQGVVSEPRALLRSIPNLRLLEAPEAEICCGSAGTYNITQPEIARTLGDRKADNLLSTGAQAVITGNIGCMTQLRDRLKAAGKPIPVWHTMEALAMAYQ